MNRGIENRKKGNRNPGAWKKWVCIILGSWLLPAVLTIGISGTEKPMQQEEETIILKYEDGKEMEVEEFLIYMLLGQIDAEAEPEAKKAQAVIARTNLMRELKGAATADIEDLAVVYMKPDTLKKNAGEEKQKELYDIMKKAVKETTGQVMLYEGTYIEALYHEISIGTTVSGEEVFGRKMEYLAESQSTQDVEAEEYMTVKIYSPQELLEKLREKGIAKEETIHTICSSLQLAEKTKNGYVKSVRIGNESLSGTQWKELFDLNSCFFCLEEWEGALRIITFGKGHGAGLSQYGANVLAKQGWSYREILKKYYQGVEIKEE